MAITSPPAPAPTPVRSPAPRPRAPLYDSSRPLWADSRMTEAPPGMVPEPRRDLSVEELIDLEQQAEFFIVLGQDEAAIDLLMGHVRNTGGISPLPYLKLLEIYKRRGDRSAYERIRERFNRRFNAYAPDWDTDLQQGKSLEDYPATMANLEGLWGQPELVMRTLDALLFRRDEAVDAFDLPAYRELLFLYSVARDFVTRTNDEHTGVDVYLPLGEEDERSAKRGVEPGPMQRHSTITSTLDMDLSIPVPAPSETPPARASVQPTINPPSDFLDLPEVPTGPGRLGRR